MNEGQEVRIHLDRAHGEYPVHADVTVPFEDSRMAEKLRIEGDGRIISDELMFPNKGSLDR